MVDNKNNIEAPNLSYGTMDASVADIRTYQPLPKPISFLKLIFDVVALTIIVVPWLLFERYVKPIRRQFLCSDWDIQHSEPPKNVFPTSILFVITVAIPIAIIIISEFVRWRYLQRIRVARSVYPIRICSTIRNISEFIGNLYISIGVFIFAHVANSLLTDTFKASFGRHRPYFFSACFRQNTYKDICADPNRWISNYTCSGETSGDYSERRVAFDIRKSFPSGHTSTAFCGLVFLGLYIYKVWRYRNMGLFPYVLIMTSFGSAVYIGMTRITDNCHHPTDVLGGAILGSLIAITAFCYMVDSWKKLTITNTSEGILREGTDLEASQ